LIIETPNQELATHTFSHYYCNEKGQTVDQFDSDLKSAQSIAKVNFGIELKSLVFPRNQFNKEYTAIAKENGIKVVRSNPNVWFWKNTSKYMALARAFDMLIPISKSLTFCKPTTKEGVLELPASRFLRPYTPKENLIKNIKLNRIKSEMTYAAKNGKCYHLWWHPHNFGYSLPENMWILEDIIKHFNYLHSNFNFQSKNMIEMFDDENQT
jgi:hypothetical protein